MKIPSIYNFNEEIYEYIGNLNTPFTYVMAGITFPDPNYELENHYFSGYSIEYVYEGNGVIEQDGEIHRINAGDFFIIHPGSVHYFANPKKPWKKIWMHVSGGVKSIQNLLDFFQITKNFLLIPNLQSPLELENILEIIKNDTPDTPFLLARHVFFLFQEIDRVSKIHLGDASIASRAKTYIDQYINVKFTVNYIAKQLSVSPVYLTRTFKEKYGIPPSEYIMQQRIDHAKLLLTQTDMPIHKIAENYGFFDSKHFSNAFSKAVGMSPSQYRKKHAYGISSKE